MKNLRTYISEKLIIKQKQKIIPRNKQELVDAILDHFKSHDGDLNDIDVSELNEAAFYRLFFDLNDEIQKYNITEIDISDWDLKELYCFLYIGMFTECKTLEIIILPDCLEVIGYLAFYNCNSLKSIIIPNSVTEINKQAFSQCSGMTSVAISNSVISIDSSAFKDCSSLTSVAIPDSIKIISSYTFEGCSGLKSVTIPDSVTTIGNEVFCKCNNLTSLIIPNSVTSIGDYAFRGCNKLTITVPNERVKKLVVDSGFNGEIIIK